MDKNLAHSRARPGRRSTGPRSDDVPSDRFGHEVVGRNCTGRNRLDLFESSPTRAHAPAPDAAHRGATSLDERRQVFITDLFPGHIFRKGHDIKCTLGVHKPSTLCTLDNVDCPFYSVHIVYMGKRVTSRLKSEPKYGTTYIRQWRKHRNLTQEQLSARIFISYASLGRIERGKQPYSQGILEALAAALNTDPASLLMRDPTDPEGIWSIWDEAKAGERKAIVEHAKIILKTKAS